MIYINGVLRAQRLLVAAIKQSGGEMRHWLHGTVAFCCVSGHRREHGQQLDLYLHSVCRRLCSPTCRCICTTSRCSGRWRQCCSCQAPLHTRPHLDMEERHTRHLWIHESLFYPPSSAYPCFTCDSAGWTLATIFRAHWNKTSLIFDPWRESKWLMPLCLPWHLGNQNIWDESTNTRLVKLFFPPHARARTRTFHRTTSKAQSGSNGIFDHVLLLPDRWKHIGKGMESSRSTIGFTSWSP